MFSAVEIIYNPNSTGPSEDNARALKRDLKERWPELPVALRATKRPGHAIELAYKAARATKQPLIVSASGDGGYHEVVNGAIRAQLEGAHPTCAVLPSGNANDHSHAISNRPLIDLMIQNKVTQLDLLKLSTNNLSIYAHSYIGLGLTPVVATELNKTSLNALKELWIVLKTFWRYRPFKIRHEGKLLKLDSLVFANIPQMAKVLTLSKDGRPDDGRFEIVMISHQRKARLLKRAFKATVSGLDSQRRYQKFEFEVLKSMPVQLDGEVTTLRAGAQVKITAEHQLLRTLAVT